MDKAFRKHHSPSENDRGQNFRQFKGIRMRKWRGWVTEIRMPKTREKIWLGSYKTAKQAARAYDPAVYCLRGPNAKFNFPNSMPAIPSASSLPRQQIQVVAAKYVLDEIPSTFPSPHNITNIKHEVSEKLASPSQPSWVLEMEWACDRGQISKARDLGLWESAFEENGGLNLEKISSIEGASLWEFIPRWLEEQPDEYIFFDSTDLWSFSDM